MLKKSLLMLLLTLFTVGPIGYSKAQEEKTIYASVDIEESLRPRINKLLYLVDTKLQKLGIKFQIAESTSDNLVNIEFTASDNDWIGGTSLYVKTLTPSIMSINPILYSQFDQPAEIPIIWAEEDRLKAAANFITAIGLYSINACEHAEPYFEAVGELKAIDTAQNGSYLDFYRANCALEAGEIKTAFEYYDRALYWNDGVPSFNAPTVNLTWMLLNYDENQLWSKKDTSGVLLDPDLALTRIICVLDCTSDKEVDLYLRRAQLYAIAERYSDAIADLSTAFELDPDNIDLYLLRGKMYLAQYEWDSALADYNTAIELDPAYPDAYYERGVLYYSILQTGVELRADALADFQHYLELAPDSDRAEDAARYVEQIEKELAALNG